MMFTNASRACTVKSDLFIVGSSNLIVGQHYIVKFVVVQSDPIVFLVTDNTAYIIIPL